MAIEISCPQCQTKMNAPDSAAGKKGRCKGCGGIVEVPKLSPELIQPEPEITAVEESYLDKRVKERQVEYFEHVAHDEAEANKRALLKQIVGLAGSALLAIGVFCPLVIVSPTATVNYYLNGKGDGKYILLLAACAAVLAVLKQFKFLWIAGLVSLGFLGRTVYRLQKGMDDLKSLAGEDPSGVIESVKFQWGIAVLAIGALLIIAAAAIPRKKAE